LLRQLNQDLRTEVERLQPLEEKLSRLDPEIKKLNETIDK